MFAHSYTVAKLSRTCYDELLTPYNLQKSSILTWLQKQDDDEDKSRTASSTLSMDVFFDCRVFTFLTFPFKF